MDINPPDFPTTTSLDPDAPRPATSALFHKRLMKTLAATMPAGASDTPEDWAEKWDAARELFDSLAPRTPAEAQAAAFAVAAMQGAMDNFDRAARPGISDEKAGRLRGSALAAGRVFLAVQRALAKRPDATAAATSRAPQATSAPTGPAPSAEALAAQAAKPGGFIHPLTSQYVPPAEEFQPRDRFGQPIPTWRWQDMTMAQRRALNAYPRDPELEAIASAEEDAMIAEQAANPDPATTVIPAKSLPRAEAGAGTQDLPRAEAGAGTQDLPRAEAGGNRT